MLTFFDALNEANLACVVDLLADGVLGGPMIPFVFLAALPL